MRAMPRSHTGNETLSSLFPSTPSRITTLSSHTPGAGSLGVRKASSRHELRRSRQVPELNPKEEEELNLKTLSPKPEIPILNQGEFVCNEDDVMAFVSSSGLVIGHTLER